MDCDVALPEEPRSALMNRITRVDGLTRPYLPPSDCVCVARLLGEHMGRRDGSPIWLGGAGSRGVTLSRIALKSGSAESYNEEWLQTLLDEHPEVLPLEQIEPGFGTPISLCRERPLDFGAGRTGALDNLFATETGGLVLVETKLWRNPEARRTVVAQAMEYAAAVFRLGYEELESAVQSARRTAAQEVEPLTALVAAHAHESFDETTFIDAVTLNLRRGRAIVAVVGEGIREDIAPLPGCCSPTRVFGLSSFWSN
jgi:hypothetical protein